MGPSEQRLQKALDALASSPHALDRLDAVRRLRERAESVEVESVAQARAEGWSWTKIGALYGMSKQGAQQRFGTQLKRQRKSGQGGASVAERDNSDNSDNSGPKSAPRVSRQRPLRDNGEHDTDART